MKKKVLGLKIDVDAIGWAITEQNVSEFPNFERSDVDYEIKGDTYLVDSTDANVVVFKIVNFENTKAREKFKIELRNKNANVFGADSKEGTGLCYLIFSDNMYSDNQRELQERAIHAMDWFIDILI